jgi:hypothetical protein
MSLGQHVRTKEINNKSFQIHLLGAGAGIKTVTELGDIILPVIGSMQGATDADGNAEVNFAEIAKAITMNMDKVNILEIIQRLLKDLAVDGSEVKIDDYFIANYGELIAVVAFALQENFSSFFDGMDMLGG